MALDLSNVAANIVAKHGQLQHGFMHLPYVSLVNDTTVRLRDDSFMSCIRVEGLDASTTRDEDLDTLKRAFASVLAQMGPDFAIYTHKISRKVDYLDDLAPFKRNDFAAAIDAKWSAGLRKRGLRDSRLTISVVKTRRLKSGWSLFRRPEQLLGGDNQARDLELLEEVVRFVQSALGTDKTRVLKASEGSLLGFIGSVQTANEQPIYPSGHVNVLADEVIAERVTFNDEGFALTDGPDGDRYGVIRALKSYPPSSWVTVFDEFALPCDYVISQSFTPMGNTEAGEMIAKKRKIMGSTADARESAGEQLRTLHESVLVRDVSLGQHHFTISLVSPDRIFLRELASELEGVANDVGARLIKDSIVKPAHYFAQFPGNLAARTRLNVATNVQFADYASFHRAGLGKAPEDVPWQTPLAVFPTASGSPYRFSFHKKGTPTQKPAGHTIISGETGSGKSFLAAFLMAQARRADARVFVFDYRRGLEMAIRAMGGKYSTIESGRATGLNPLSVETDDEGIDWLNDWLTRVLAPDVELDARQSRAIVDNVRRNAEFDPALRRWDVFAKQFASTDDDGALQRRVEEWVKGGRFGWVFGETAEDNFSLDGDVVGFDVTEILKAQSDRERMAVLTYIFRRIERQVMDSKRTIIVIDEAWKAIDNDYFASVIEDWLGTLRKQNALVILLALNPDQLANSRVGPRIFSYFPTQIIFPDPKSAAKDYDAMRLNPAELKLVTSRSVGRQFLLREDQGSVVLDADAAHLGDYLHLLGGGSSGLAVAGEDFRTNPEFWRKI